MSLWMGVKKLHEEYDELKSELACKRRMNNFNRK